LKGKSRFDWRAQGREDASGYSHADLQNSAYGAACAIRITMPSLVFGRSMKI
jgi:hypothetical protein